MPGSLNIKKYGNGFTAYAEFGKDIRFNLGRLTLASGHQMERIIYDVVTNSWTSSSGFQDGTGALARSFKAVLLPATGGSRRVFVGSGLPYASVHQTGNARITPNKGKYLAIPLDRAERFFPTIHKHRVFRDKYLILSAKINQKPVGGGKGYLDMAADRHSSQASKPFTAGLAGLWNKIVGRGKK
jgi:hypothetical protein